MHCFATALSLRRAYVQNVVFIMTVLTEGMQTSAPTADDNANIYGKLGEFFG